MYKLTTYTLILLSVSSAKGQAFDNLNLSVPENPRIKDVFELFISEKSAKKITSSSGIKITLKEPVLLYNGDSLKVKSIKTRGKTSLTFRRKSLSISLRKPIVIEGKEIKKLALLALQMDRNYWRNRLSFLLLEQVELFPLINRFSELRINNASKGIYLFVRKADDFAEEINSPLLIRSEVADQFEIDHENKDRGKSLWKVFQKSRSLPEKFNGKELADTLSTILDLNQYWRWLAFNYMVMNGDYADEVFYYYDYKSSHFRIIPWDYDDIFSIQPHEGWQQRMMTIDHRMIFSGEAYLDRVIDKDEYLYSHYLDEFRKLISILKPENIKIAFEQVYRELYPYYSQSEVIGMSSTDLSGLTNLEIFENDLKKHYNFLLQRYNVIQSLIEK